MTMATQKCPTCRKPVEPNEQYPNYICSTCVDTAIDETGRSIKFYNTSRAGGFKALYADTGRLRNCTICYISGIRCYADETVYGGIVVQPVIQYDS